MLDPASRPGVQFEAVIRRLADEHIRWVLTGSAVLAVYGASIRPNDIDVTPDLDPANLSRLAGVLRSVDAIPAHHPEWDPGPTLEQCRAWEPFPATEGNLDHLS